MKSEVLQKYSKYLLLILPLIGLFSCKNEKNDKDKPVVAPPVKVEVLKVSQSNLSSSREYSGTVASEESTTVSFSVAGTITNLYVSEGQKVAKGQKLGELRKGEYLNAYNIAQAQLAEAQDGYDRLKKLHDANALPDVKWVEIQQKLKQAQNAAEMAKRTLNDTELLAPVSGTVTRKFADAGQTVMPVEPIYEIVSTSRLTIDISVAENEIGDFSIGEKAVVNLESVGLKDLEGKVSQKTVTADPLTRSYTVKVALPSGDGKVLPGMIGEVSFPEHKLGEKESLSGVCLPSQAVLLNEDNRWFVWVVRDSIAERCFVTIDQMVADGVVVTSGLQPQDMVIVRGMQKVGTGSRVIPQFSSVN